MTLYQLLEGLSTTLSDCDITGVTDHTGYVTQGMVFVCVKGGSFDGHDVAAEMLEKGAAAVICERDMGLGAQQILVEDSRKTYGDLCAAWYGHPERQLKLIGVTGTNGKTTTAMLIRSILKAAGHRVGLIGTVQYEIGAEILPAPNTTPLTASFFELLAKMADAGCDYVVMEVSSFGLVQHRIGPAWFETAVFTNLTQDHLDIHGDMEQYYLAKRMLFDRCETAIVNADDPYGKRLIGEITCPVVSYGMTESAQVRAEGAELAAGHSHFTLVENGTAYPIETVLTGRFNLENATAALLACRAVGMALPEAAEHLRHCSGVRGRCEQIPISLPFTVICDYAHTPDALEKILEALRECTQGRLLALFGCGGDRDAAKRPKMARAAAQYADFLMITSDNPRNEDPDAIIRDILTGLTDTTTTVPYQTEPDRAEAIYLLMRQAQPGDVIVLAGKGHEDYQILAGNVKIHMDERELVRQAEQRILNA